MTVQSRYGQLYSQAELLHRKILVTAANRRISFEKEVNALDFATMKLAKAIRKSTNPALLDLSSLKGKVQQMNQLMYENPQEESIVKIASRAFTVGVIGGTVSHLMTQRPAEIENTAPEQGELVCCCSGSVASDIANQQKKVSQAALSLEKAEIAKNQAIENSMRAQADFLDGFNFKAKIGGIDIISGEVEVRGNTGTLIYRKAPEILNAKLLETEACSQYNRALVAFGQEKATMTHLQSSVGDTETGFWGATWDGLKWTFGIAIRLFSRDF